MPHPRVDVVVLTSNDRPDEEAAAQATLRARSGVDVRVVAVGNGCRPEVVPPTALTVCLPENVGIPGGRDAGADALREAGDPAEWLFFLDNDAGFPRTDVLARLVAESEQHPEAAWVQPRLTGPEDATTPPARIPPSSPPPGHRTADARPSSLTPLPSWAPAPRVCSATVTPETPKRGLRGGCPPCTRPPTPGRVWACSVR
ncbi:hypothetical protein ABTX77_42045 [Streptomyces sp. NPDC097704]|uniref:glycosyltransferase family 2 protein n=1 Tax=Streptomyces sp. NPDC097704 TaxID=3157101 RepID=UPI00332FB07A